MKEAVIESSGSESNMPGKEVLDLMETPRSESEILHGFIEGLRSQMASGAIKKVFEKFLESEDEMRREGFEIVLDGTSYDKGSSGYVRINLRIADWFREELSETGIDVIDIEKPLIDTFFSDEDPSSSYVKIDGVIKNYEKAKRGLHGIISKRTAAYSLKNKTKRENNDPAEKTMKAAA